MFQRVISQDREWIKTLIVSRDEFLEIKNKDTKTVDDNIKLLVNSFGDNKRDYLYSEEWSYMKYNLAIEIINKHDVFSGYKQTSTYKNASRPYDEGKPDKNKVLQQLQQLQQLQRLQQLERIEQLQRLQQLEHIEQLQRLQQLEPTNLSYEAFSNIDGAVFYLDPPYESATHKTYKGDFDSQKFYDWAVEMSKKNIVLISSYEISDDRFKCVCEFKTARSTMQSCGAGKRTEKLYMVV